MKSFLKQIEDKFELYESADDIQEIVNEDADDDKCMHCEGNGCAECDNLKEMSVTGGVAHITTPFAFSKKLKEKKKIKYPGVAEALDRKYERIIESYRRFSNGDPKLTPEGKVKGTIREVSKKLKEIEELVRYTSKLKLESGMSKDGYGPRVENALNKISERLIKISERVRSLGE